MQRFALIQLTIPGEVVAMEEHLLKRLRSGLEGLLSETVAELRGVNYTLCGVLLALFRQLKGRASALCFFCVQARQSNFDPCDMEEQAPCAKPHETRSVQHDALPTKLKQGA